ncbi:MAG: hypothetical protein ACMUIG_01120 [Thermoplasmatota archaeon]
MARIRETARRLFAIEYNRSEHEDRGTEDNAPNYLITPLGDRVNRIYLIGVMMNKTNTGTEDSPMYRAEVRDPTGTFYLYAGQYQPQAMSALSVLEPPILVGVVGKVRTFMKEDGTFYTSVKPETVFPVDIPERDRWILSTAKFTRDKILSVRDAMEMEDPKTDALMDKGHGKKAAECGVESVGLYGSVDLAPFIDSIRTSLGMVMEGGGTPLDNVPKLSISQITEGGSFGAESAEGGDEGDEDPAEVKEKVMAIIKELSNEKGAFYRDILSKCEDEGIDKILLEETVQELLDEGSIYEPTIGIIKPI